jgi:hypothetical protein
MQLELLRERMHVAMDRVLDEIDVDDRSGDTPSVVPANRKCLARPGCID